jgi:hypothetical protein
MDATTRTIQAKRRKPSCSKGLWLQWFSSFRSVSRPLTDKIRTRTHFGVSGSFLSVTTLSNIEQE